MRFKMFFVSVSLILLYLNLSTCVLYASDRDNLNPKSPDYSNVNVVIGCEWGLDGKIENATVYDQSDAKEPHLTILKPNGESSVLTLIKGIKVDILDHKNHELLKTYIGEYVK